MIDFELANYYNKVFLKKLTHREQVVNQRSC